jgi:hypothetical protein
MSARTLAQTMITMGMTNMAKIMSKENAFHEVFHNKPSTVDTSKSKTGQRKQMIAISLSKAGLSKPSAKK